MTNIFTSSKKEADEIQNLLDKNLPNYRKAYSDRTAWLMASLSELVYEDFEKKENLKKNIEFLRMKLEKIYDKEDTQAILVSNKDFLVLAFRGTETNSIKDIKTDLKAKLIHHKTNSQTKGKVHAGFSKAFEQIAADIQKNLAEKKYQEKSLFITGHSLGGALATVAMKRLSHRAGISACYTFGSPRIANKNWIVGIKTPIYRLVNAADPVPMLPPSFFGYFHCGNMRYLTNCAKGKYENVQLLYSVNWFYRIIHIFRFRLKALFIARFFKKMIADHSITIYRKKLKIIAERRNR